MTPPAGPVWRRGALPTPRSSQDFTRQLAVGRGGFTLHASPVDASAPDATRPPEHYITTIYIRGLLNGVDTVIGLWEFASTDPEPPSVSSPLPPGLTSITAYEWCTLQGLWQTDAIPV